MILALPSALALVLAAPAATSSPVLGDTVNGARLFHLYCAGCHGPHGRGDGPIASQLNPSPADLHSPALMFSRTNEDLLAVINQGGPATKHSYLMPAQGEALSLLDAWDLVALLRNGQVSIDEVFPGAIRYAVKRYTVDDDGLKRLRGVLGDVSKEEREVDVAAMFGSGRPLGVSAIYVAQEPLALDSLKPKEKAGYVALFEVPASEVIPPEKAAKPAKKKGKEAPEPVATSTSPFAWSWTKVPVAIAMDRDGVIKSVVIGGNAEDRSRVAPLLAPFAGQGGKRNDKRPEYKALKGPKGSDALTKTINRLYYRGLEGAQMFDKEEAERNWADPSGG